MEFTIISNNCWGAEIYKELKLQYNTPFVGLFIPPESYIKMLSNLNFFLANQLRFKNTSDFEIYNLMRIKQNLNYPIAELAEGIEIHFLHYGSSTEALEKWNRRIKRMNMDVDKLFIKFCDREVTNHNLIIQFDNLTFKNKVCFTVKSFSTLKSSVQIFEHRRNAEVIDGKSLYSLSKHYFDPIKWVLTKNGDIGLLKKLKLLTRIAKKEIKNLLDSYTKVLKN